MATDTVYGLHCSAGSEDSLSRVGAMKGWGQRAFILLVGDLSRLEEVAAEVSGSARRLVERYWPGPLTLVFRAAPRTPAWLLGPGGSVAVRWPGDQLCGQVLRRLKSTLVSTSANLRGGAPCLSGTEAAAGFLDKVDIVVDSGAAPSDAPSTIVDTTLTPHKVIRQGSLKVDPDLLRERP
jgi:L-threonylcarbamoyladenylate synthase